jgi:hypothetical protein
LQVNINNPTFTPCIFEGNGTLADPILALSASLSPIQYVNSIAVDRVRNMLYYVTWNFGLYRIMLNNGSQTRLYPDYSPWNSVEVEASGSILVATSLALSRISLSGVSVPVFTLGSPNNLDSGTTSTIKPILLNSISVEPSGGFLFQENSGTGKLRRVSGTTVTTLAGAANCNPNPIPETVSSNWCLGQNYSYYSQQFQIVSDLQGGYIWLDGLKNILYRVYSSGRLERMSMDSQANFSTSADSLTSRLWSPSALAVNPQGGYVVADDFRISTVSDAGRLSTVVGNGYFGYTSDGESLQY